MGFTLTSHFVAVKKVGIVDSSEGGPRTNNNLEGWQQGRKKLLVRIT